MDRVYFLLGEMTHLRYFIPLVKESNKRNIQSHFLIYFSGKYNCPSKHGDELDKACEKYNVEKILANNFKEKNKIIFGVEKSCAEAINKQGISQENDFYVLLYQGDHMSSYNVYEKFARNIIFPSDWTLKRCESFIGDKRTDPTEWSIKKIKSPKNVCLGSPKYDVQLNKKEIINKYNLTNKRKILFLFPTPCPTSKHNLSAQRYGKLYHGGAEHGLSVSQINALYDTIKSENFEILVKSRGKHLVPKGLEGDRLFYDESWFPHTTMELMKISDLTVMVDSTTVKECAMMKSPFINFDLKNEKAYITAKQGYRPLFDFDFCKNYTIEECTNLSLSDLAEDFRKSINYLSNTDFSDQFQRAIDQYLFKPGESSKKIVDFALDNYNNKATIIR